MVYFSFRLKLLCNRAFKCLREIFFREMEVWIFFLEKKRWRVNFLCWNLSLISRWMSVRKILTSIGKMDGCSFLVGKSWERRNIEVFRKGFFSSLELLVTPMVNFSSFGRDDDGTFQGLFLPCQTHFSGARKYDKLPKVAYLFFTPRDTWWFFIPFGPNLRSGLLLHELRALLILINCLPCHFDWTEDFRSNG